VCLIRYDLELHEEPPLLEEYALLLGELLDPPKVPEPAPPRGAPDTSGYSRTPAASRASAGLR
jgi:hypothetical protein